MDSVLKELPSLIVAGTAVEFDREYSGIDPAVYTATAYLTNASNSYSISSVDFGYNHFRFLATPLVTTTWVAGDYVISVQIDDGAGGIYVTESASVMVQPALGTAADLRSHAKRVLDALEATLEGKASQDQLSYSIRGRSLSRMSPGELLDWRDRYKAEYAKEKREEDIRNGRGHSATIRVRF